jgi:hypothetical protein
MKKIIFITALMSCLMSSMFTLNAQVNYHVQFGWDDSNCDCSGTVTKEGRILIYEYPGGSFVDDTGWFTMTSNPCTHYDYASGLRDCVDDHPCYTVYVLVRYKDSQGTCCQGSSNANTTGHDLFVGYTFPNTIILN